MVYLCVYKKAYTVRSYYIFTDYPQDRVSLAADYRKFFFLISKLYRQI